MPPDLTSAPPAARKTAAILSRTDQGPAERMFTTAIRSRLERSFRLLPGIMTPKFLEDGAHRAEEVQVVFGTWGFPILDAAGVSRFSSAEHLFYAAGSIKPFGRAWLEAGIPVSSSKDSNARMVADFCLAQILLATKRYFQRTQRCRSPEDWQQMLTELPSQAGHRGAAVGLIGGGLIAQHLIRHLKSRDFEIHLVDPYLSDAEIHNLGVKRCSLEEVFAECEVVSNHLPNLPSLEGVIQGHHFLSMRAGATFINTGRGAQIRENEMTTVLAERDDLIVLLDVTNPEPPNKGSLLYTLPNVLLSPHMAGCVGQETQLLVEEAVTSAERWLRGETLTNLESLDRYDLIA